MAPLINGDQYCGFDTLFGYDLRPIDEARFKYFIEVHLDVLHLPPVAHAIP